MFVLYKVVYTLEVHHWSVAPTLLGTINKGLKN